MSEATSNAVERAIADHMESENPGAYVTAFGLVIEYTTIENAKNHTFPLWFMSKDDQSPAHTRGLYACASELSGYDPE